MLGNRILLLSIGALLLFFLLIFSAQQAEGYLSKTYSTLTDTIIIAPILAAITAGIYLTKTKWMQ